jgi:hypothetical protein
MTEAQIIALEIWDILDKMDMQTSVERLLTESKELNPRLIRYAELILNIKGTK